MKKIENLVHLFDNSLNYSKQDWINLKEKLNSLSSDLIQLHRQEPKLSEESIAHELLRTDIKDQNYVRINNRLYDDLIQEIIEYNYNSSKFTPYQKAFFTDHKLRAVLDILIGLGNNATAFSIAKKLHKRSVHFDFTSIRLSTSIFLLKYYSTIVPNKKKAEFFQKEVSEALYFQNIESELQQLNFDIQSQYQFRSNISKEQTEEFINRTLSLKHPDRPGSTKFNVIYNTLLISLYDEIGDNESALHYSLKGLDHLKTLDYKMKSNEKVFQFHISRAYLRMNKIVKAKEALESYLKEANSKGQNVFNRWMQLLHIELRLGNYEDAHEIFLNLKGLRKNKNIHLQSQESIIRTELLFGFLNYSKAIDTSAKFNRLQILNKLDFLKSNYEESNLDLDVLDLLLSLSLRAKSRLSELKSKYSYLQNKKIRKTNPDFRPLCFIQLLVLIYECNFHEVAVDRKSKKLVEKLQSVSIEDANSPLERESIPYEVLWDILVQNLKSSSSRSKKQEVMSVG